MKRRAALAILSPRMQTGLRPGRASVQNPRARPALPSSPGKKKGGENGTKRCQETPSPSCVAPKSSSPRRRALGLVAESEIRLRFSERTFCGAAKRRRQKGPVITGPKTSQRRFRGRPQSYCEPPMRLLQLDAPAGTARPRRA